MNAELTAPHRYRRSTFCGQNGCVEVAAPSLDEIVVRDAKDDNPDAPVLRFTGDEWDAFLAGVNNGEFAREALHRA